MSLPAFSPAFTALWEHLCKAGRQSIDLIYHEGPMPASIQKVQDGLQFSTDLIDTIGLVNAVIYFNRAWTAFSAHETVPIDRKIQEMAIRVINLASSSLSTLYFAAQVRAYRLGLAKPMPYIGAVLGSLGLAVHVLQIPIHWTNYNEAKDDQVVANYHLCSLIQSVVAVAVAALAISSFSFASTYMGTLSLGSTCLGLVKDYYNTTIPGDIPVFDVPEHFP